MLKKPFLLLNLKKAPYGEILIFLSFMKTFSEAAVRRCFSE